MREYMGKAKDWELFVLLFDRIEMLREVVIAVENVMGAIKWVASNKLIGTPWEYLGIWLDPVRVSDDALSDRVGLWKSLFCGASSVSLIVAIDEP